MDSAEFLLGTVTAVSSVNGLRVQLDGQAESMSKYYKMLLNGAGVPEVGSRVIIMKHSGTYVILGKIGVPSDDGGDEYVAKSGDTMTGNLNIVDSSPGVIGKATGQDSSAAAETAGTSVGFRLQDKNGNDVAIFSDRYDTTGEHGALIAGYRMVNGSPVDHVLRLLVDAAGNRIVKLTSAAAWRLALGLGNASGALPITVAQGGTGAVSASGHTVFAGPNSNAAGAPSFRNLTSDDLPAISASNISGTIQVSNGGTGATGVTKTSVGSEIFTVASGFKFASADFASWGKVAMIRFSATASAAITANTWTTVATLVTGKRSAQLIILDDIGHHRMKIDGASIQVYGTLAQDEQLTLYAVYLLP